MIRIFAEAFDCCNIFSKRNTNMDEDEKENFRLELVKKRLGFPSNSICRVEVYLPLIFCTCAIETVKLCISLFLLLANLCSQVVTVLVKTTLLLHISHTLETFHKSSVTKLLTVCYGFQEYLKVFRSYRPFRRGNMVFYRRRLIRFTFLRHCDVSFIIFTTFLSMLLLEQNIYDDVKTIFFLKTFKLRIKVTL